ncbi:hypothetical protein BGZ96_005801 [Linnemannia gamsii]|uniref:C2H2-type domain-containing protein n=1 Tax=Linnemannia gamsii TaxID=64522 RepID=A0ABQ7K3G6_9FUNG|nr:hypothetical protein BGZ96_005801 [Linnemannia gamsii]
MDQNLGNPSVFQESFQESLQEGGLHDNGTSPVNDGSDVNGINNALFENEILINSDRLPLFNFSEEDTLSSTQLFLSFPNISRDMSLLQQQQQQQQSEQLTRYQVALTDSSAVAFSLEHAFAQQQQSQVEQNANVPPMPEFLSLQHVLGLQQAHQDTPALDSLQQAPILPSQQYYDTSVLDPLHPHLPSSSLDVRDTPLAPIIATSTADPVQIHDHLYNHTLLENASSTYSIPMNFSHFRSPAFDRLSSPDEGSVSPGSEHSYFDMNDAYSSSSPLYPPSPLIYLYPNGADYLTGSLQDFSISVGSGLFSGVPCSLASSVTSTSTVTATPYNTVMSSSPSTAPQAIQVPPSAFSQANRKNTSQPKQLTITSPDSFHSGSAPFPSPASSTGGTFGSYSSTSSTSPPFISSAPALPSPLKQQFNRTSFSDDEDSDLLNEEEQESKANPKRRRRVRKTIHKTVVKPKGPPITLHCDHPGCQVTCSSYPSLIRHKDTHKWRGRYSPVRCEACHSSLSNEFSVQRHILRSPEPSRCHRMRVYSTMLSETEIKSTVRFYPTRPHGKKTITVDLEKMKKKYLLV